MLKVQATDICDQQIQLNSVKGDGMYVVCLFLCFMNQLGTLRVFYMNSWGGGGVRKTFVQM